MCGEGRRPARAHKPLPQQERLLAPQPSRGRSDRRASHTGDGEGSTPSSGTIGVWRSPEARRSGGPEVASSNLATPTNLSRGSLSGRAPLLQRGRAEWIPPRFITDNVLVQLRGLRPLRLALVQRQAILWPRTNHAQVAELGIRAALRALWGGVPMQVRLLS